MSLAVLQESFAQRLLGFSEWSFESARSLLGVPREFTGVYCIIYCFRMGQAD